LKFFKVRIPLLYVSAAVVFALGFLFYVNKPFHFPGFNKHSVTRIYFADNISMAHQKLIDRFNQEYQGKIKVIPVNLPFTKFSTNERKELLARALRSKSDRIDVFAIDLIWVPRFARWGEPLDTNFSMKERSQILDFVLESCYYNNHLVAIPLYIDIGMMYYRDDLLKTFPDYDNIVEKLKQSITWEELIELKYRYIPGKPFYLFAAKNFEGLICSFMEMLVEQNETIFAADSIQLNTPGARKALTFLVDLVHKYKMTPLTVTRFNEVQTYQYAIENDALFFRGWPGLIRHFSDVIGQNKIQYISKAALPHFKGASPAYVFGGWNLMISKFSTKKHAAVEFVKFVLKEESQKLMFEEGGYLPIIKHIYEDSVFYKNTSDLMFYRQLLNNGIHRPSHINYTKISDVLSYYIRLAIRKEIPIQQALAKATRDINSRKTLIR